MAPSVTVTNVETLIVKATSPLNRNEDPNIIQKICQAVMTEPLGMQTAIRLIAHKMQSPQEWEAMQSLLILQSCVNNCGKVFHSEVGQFRFLNEMIKVVSPNYLGNHRPLHIKKRIIELLYTWTIDIAHQPKINDAYQSLKTQKVIQEDPMYLGVALPPVENKMKIVLKDAEKSKRLQQLLQSKKPDDVLEANALIKKIVKDDERKLERSSRRTIEVETALNNASLLDEILSQYERSPGENTDLDFLKELNDSCSSIQTSIYRFVSELDDKEEGIGELLKANDELSRVMGRYKLIVTQNKYQNNCSADNTVVPKLSTEETLLDLNSCGTSDPVKEHSHDVQETVDDTTTKSAHVEERLDLISILDDPVSEAEAKSEHSKSFLPELLIPEKQYQLQCDTSEDIATRDALHDIDLLGCDVMRQHLPPNSFPMGAQFKMKQKVSINQLKCQQIEASQLTLASTSDRSSHSSIVRVDKSESAVHLVSPPDKISASELESLKSNSTNSNHQEIAIDEEFMKVHSLNSTKTNVDQPRVDSNSHHKTNIECNGINNLEIELADILPDDTRPPSEIINRNKIKVSVHYTLNKPREDTIVFVVTTSSTHTIAVCNYNLHVICPEGCSVRLLEPSSTTFSPVKPFLPSPVITQIVLFSNPKQVTDDALRLILKYKVGDKTQADYGEVELTS